MIEEGVGVRRCGAERRKQGAVGETSVKNMRMTVALRSWLAGRSRGAADQRLSESSVGKMSSR